MKSNGFKILLIIITYFVIGLVREDLFVNINYILYFKSSGQDASYYYQQSIYSLISNLSYNTLYILKWALTLLFALFYLLLVVVFNYWLFAKNIWKETATILAILLVFSAFLMFIGYLKSDFSFSYKISRFLMGIAQSPLLFIISAPFVWSQTQSNKKEY